MSLQETMAYGQIHWIEGTIVIASIISAVYVLLCIRLLIIARREGMDVCAGCFIPIRHIVILIKWFLLHKKHNKKVDINEEFTLD